jgi:ATP-dependent Lhr-like helicase
MAPQPLIEAFRGVLENASEGSGLRSAFEAAVAAVAERKNALVLVEDPGAGRLETVLLPLLTRMEREGWEPTSVLYLVPMPEVLAWRRRVVEAHARTVGRRAAVLVAHSSPAQRRDSRTHPPDLLMTTPEEVELLLVGGETPARGLFPKLRAVILDDVHLWAADDRGAHAAALVERLSRLCGRDLQRLSLAAPVGNPAELLAWSAGGSERSSLCHSNREPRAATPVLLDHMGSIKNAAVAVSQMHPGERRVAFVDGLSRMKSLRKGIRSLGSDASLLHPGVTVEEREEIWSAFTRSNDGILLVSDEGLLVGEPEAIQRVYQIDVPSTLSAFQRRLSVDKAAGAPRCVVLTTRRVDLLRAAAALRLHGQDHLEDLPIQRRSAHVLAHQVMALSLQEEGIADGSWWDWLSAAVPFAELGFRGRREVVDHMLEAGIFMLSGGRLVLGPVGQALYARTSFRDLSASLAAPARLLARWGSREVGSVDAEFLIQNSGRSAIFGVGARAWQVETVHWKRATVQVVPVDEEADGRWAGAPALLSPELCGATRELLCSKLEEGCWSPRTAKVIASLRKRHAALEAEGNTLRREHPGLRLWTFAGGRANGLLRAIFSERLGARIHCDNLSVGFDGDAGENSETVLQVLAELRAAGGPNRSEALACAAGLSLGPLVALRPCISEGLQAELLTDLAFDVEGAARVCAAPTSRPTA